MDPSPGNLLPAIEEDTFGLMFSMQVDGRYTTVKHDDRLTFEHCGTAISNPCRDESTTVTVDPRRYGFTEVDGHQSVLRRDLEGGEYLLLSEVCNDQYARLSRCDSTGQVLFYCYLEDVP